MNRLVSVVFFFKQKTAYEMRISDWSSDVCSSDLAAERRHFERVRTAVWHFHPRRPARHSRHRYSTNVARLVTEKSCDMLHRHMALDRIAADHGRVARRQLVGHAISQIGRAHV